MLVLFSPPPDIATSSADSRLTRHAFPSRVPSRLLFEVSTLFIGSLPILRRRFMCENCVHATTFLASTSAVILEFLMSRSCVRFQSKRELERFRKWDHLQYRTERRNDACRWRFFRSVFELERLESVDLRMKKYSWKIKKINSLAFVTPNVEIVEWFDFLQNLNSRVISRRSSNER